jgi:hypothetical protein
LLKQNKKDIPEDFLDLQDLTEYAVDLRYDSFELDNNPLDRKAILIKVTSFIDYVEKLLKKYKS